MKKYIVFLSIIVLILSPAVLFNLYTSFLFLRSKENSKEEFVFGYNNFTEINRAILQIERKIFKNGKGSVQDKIIDVLKKDLFAGHLSYSCDTEFYFLTPVSEY